MTKYTQLEKIAKLKEQWTLTKKEFEIEKEKILNSSDNSNNNFKNSLTYYNKINDFYDDLFLAKGRMNRTKYLLVNLFYIFIVFIIGVWTSILLELGINIWIESIGIIILIISFIAIVLSYSIYIVNIKRLHDLNASWWWSILICSFYPITAIVLLLIPWIEWDNRFWPQ